jgi:hypothetical protein
MGIFGVNWRDVLIVYDSTCAFYESQTNVMPAVISTVLGYPSGFV